jgi:hypothetical protein
VIGAKSDPYFFVADPIIASGNSLPANTTKHHYSEQIEMEDALIRITELVNGAKDPLVRAS